MFLEMKLFAHPLQEPFRWRARSSWPSHPEVWSGAPHWHQGSRLQTDITHIITADNGATWHIPTCILLPWCLWTHVWFPRPIDCKISERCTLRLAEAFLHFQTTACRGSRWKRKERHQRCHSLNTSLHCSNHIYIGWDTIEKVVIMRKPAGLFVSWLWGHISFSFLSSKRWHIPVGILSGKSESETS